MFFHGETIGEAQDQIIMRVDYLYVEDHTYPYMPKTVSDESWVYFDEEVCGSY